MMDTNESAKLKNLVKKALNEEGITLEYYDDLDVLNIDEETIMITEPLENGDSHIINDGNSYFHSIINEMFTSNYIIEEII